MGLHPSTAATLHALRGVEWFRSAGHAEGRTIHIVTSWEEALDWNEEGAWQDVQLEAANQLSRGLLAKSVEDFRRWNQVVAVVKPVVVALVDEKTRDVMEREGLEKTFKDSVLWDILHLALEAEFSDVMTPGFFAQLGYWYERGNWPCGWDGPMAGGRLVVF